MILDFIFQNKKEPIALILMYILTNFDILIDLIID